MDPEREQLSDLESDIKATSEDLIADAERVREIEAEKARLPVGDPRLTQLARESAALTALMASKARVERQLAEDAEAIKST
jgi:hypothetical protein